MTMHLPRRHDDDDGMTEAEHERLHANDPPERDTPEVERSHPETTPDEEVS
jgi:hypothetical protein